MGVRSLVAAVCLFIFNLSASSMAHAATCSTDESKRAWGEYWVVRSGSSCDCVIRQNQYTCGTGTGGLHTLVQTATVTTLSSSCDRACEATTGYDAAVGLAKERWKAGDGANEYQCATEFNDRDLDGLGDCVDSDDWNPRVWVKIANTETVCDGVDNNNYGGVDDGLGTCDLDQKRPWDSGSLQGDAAGAVDVAQGTLLRTDVDATVQGPYGPLVFSRTYNSRRSGNDAALGIGWVHSFAVYLKQMPSWDGRWKVQLGTGENQYFRCRDTGSGDQSCAIDDHIPRGNLRKFDPDGGSSRRWFFYPGDGTRYEFDTDDKSTGRYAYKKHVDGAGLTLSEATTDTSGRIDKVQTANSSVYLKLVYDSNGLDKIRLSSASANEILDVSVGTSGRLGAIYHAPTLAGGPSTDYETKYEYDTSTNNLTAVKQYESAGGTQLTVAAYGYDTSDRVTSLADAGKTLAVSYLSCSSGCISDTSTTTQVTYTVSGTESTAVKFAHTGRWVTFRSGYTTLGGVHGKTTVWTDHGRVSCREDDRSITTRYTYVNQILTLVKVYGSDGSCDTATTVDRWVDFSWSYNTTRQSWRLDWERRKSAYGSSGLSSCTGTVRPSGCAETRYDYVSSADDRLQRTTQVGYTRLIDDSTPKQVRSQRIYYFGLDTGTCTGSYTGLPCRIETQTATSSGSVLARTDFTYVATGSTAGALKTTSRYKSNSVALTTTYSNHNEFGSPTTIYDEAGVRTRIAYNGWNAITSETEDAALLDDAVPPVASIYPVTQYAYNTMRAPTTVTLPKGNKQVYKYLTGTSDYGRMKAFATADASGNLLEIMRYAYDQMGRRTEEKVLDSIASTCTEDTCSDDSRARRDYDAAGRLKKTYLYSSDTSDPENANATRTYSAAYLTETTDYRGTVTKRGYDDRGRLAFTQRDPTGENAITIYGYDARGQLLTTTSPTGVVTRTERDDFGQLVLERSTTRGDMRYEYNAAGVQTQRRGSSYNSSSSAQSTCYTSDWLGRQTGINYDCDGSTEVSFDYDGDNTPSGACPSATRQQGRLSRFTGSNTTARVMCYHPRGELYAYYQYSSTWDNYYARGQAQIFDANGNLVKEYVNDRAQNRDWAREIEYVFDATLLDRVKYVRHKLTSASSWTNLTSPTTAPTYFAFGGFKTLVYANGITETNTRDAASRLTRRKTDDGTTTFTDLNLAYDDTGNITRYNDTGKRHLDYYAALDRLNRLRCTSRASIGSCSGSSPWSDKFNESFDYDDSGNRTMRRYGAYTNADQDSYVYETGKDVIDKVVSGGTDKHQTGEFKGNIYQITQPNFAEYAYTYEDTLYASNDNYLGQVTHWYTPFRDRWKKVAICNQRPTYYFYTPEGSGATSYEVKLLDMYYDCNSEYPRQYRTYVYLEGRPISVIHSTFDWNGSAYVQSEVTDGTYWIHTDQLGTPIYVTTNTKTERWRWENDPFGRADPIEYTVSSQDVNPDADSSSGSPPKYNTCCCPSCDTGSASCGTTQSSCNSGCCAGATSVAVVWTGTYSPTSANNVRVHFSEFQVEPGTSRTGADYVRLQNGASTVVADLTGNLGAHWSPWSGDGTMTVKLYSNTSTVARGLVIDQLEYTTATNGRFVQHLRMPGQLWDSDVEASYNYNRWYRREDGRYLSPDPIGLDGGELGYFAYMNSNPIAGTDPQGLGNCGAEPTDECVAREARAREARSRTAARPRRRIHPPIGRRTFVQYDATECHTGQFRSKVWVELEWSYDCISGIVQCQYFDYVKGDWVYQVYAVSCFDGLPPAGMNGGDCYVNWQVFQADCCFNPSGMWQDFIEDYYECAGIIIWRSGPRPA